MKKSLSLLMMRLKAKNMQTLKKVIDDQRKIIKDI